MPSSITSLSPSIPPKSGDQSVRARQLPRHWQRDNRSSTSAAPCARRRRGRSRRPSPPRRARRGAMRRRRPKLRSGKDRKRKRPKARSHASVRKGIVQERGGSREEMGVKRLRCLLPAPTTATFAAELMARRDASRRLGS